MTNSFNNRVNQEDKARKPTRTLREFAAIKNITEIQMRSIWDYSPVSKPEPHFKCHGKSNKHYYILSELEDWFVRDRTTRKARIGIAEAGE